jgi:glutamyl/glutaminyl-tRNA synthetase
LALLGWNDGTDKELYTLEELVEAFDLNRVHKAGAKFDPKKQMVQSPTFDQTRRRRFGAYLRSIVASKNYGT